MQTQFTHKDRVALYKKIITDKKVVLSDFTVALMRNAAPGQLELDAINDAVKELGWQT
jgi:hypothetical protein